MLSGLPLTLTVVHGRRTQLCVNEVSACSKTVEDRPEFRILLSWSVSGIEAVLMLDFSWGEENWAVHPRELPKL